MRTNNFTQNMLKKSNAELENILEDKKTYTDEAIQAVIWELENRNIIEKGSITHNPVILEKDVLIEEKELDKAIMKLHLKQRSSQFYTQKEQYRDLLSFLAPYLVLFY